MHTLADLVLPHRCPCGAEARDPAQNPAPRALTLTVCARCRPALLDGAGHLVRPYPSPPGLPPCSAAAAYAGGVRRCLIAYKERGRRDLAPALALALLKALERASAESAGGAPVLLVPVPASRAALRARGFDHVALLARWVVRLSPGQDRRRYDWCPLLLPTRRVADQAGLPAGARTRNVAGSLRIRPGGARRAAAASQRVVLVDDVLTSGATLAEASRALRAGGVRPTAAVVVAAVFRPESWGVRPVPSRGRTG
jgi:predicted amidophosphoribosyltransferase